MRVVLLTDDGPGAPGGVAAWVDAIARGLRAGGHAVAVYARARPDLAPGVVPVRGPSFGRRGGTWLGLRALPDLARADLVVAATWPAGTLACRLGGRFAVVAHGSDVTRPTRDPRGRARVFALADRVFAVSRFLADPLGADVLPAPVDARPRPLPPVPGVWGFVGRAVPTKGGDAFVRWVAAAGVRGLVAGDGPERPRWEALARSLRADVTFLGRVPAAEVWPRIGLLAVPSRPWADGSGAEGLSLAAIEAAAAGVPVVGTAVGGIPEALGPAGLVVPDDAGGAVEAITGWWTPERGAAAWAWARDAHGVARACDALVGPKSSRAGR